MTRKSTPFLAAVGGLLLPCALAPAHAAMGVPEGERRLRETAAVARVATAYRLLPAFRLEGY